MMQGACLPAHYHKCLNNHRKSTIIYVILNVAIRQCSENGVAVLKVRGIRHME